MRHSKRIIGWLVIVATAAWCLYDWTWLSDGPAYFAGDWRRAAFVAVVSVMGGLGVFGIMQLSRDVRHRLAALIFGTGAVLAVVSCVYSLWQLIRMREFLAEARILWFVAAVELAMFSFVGGLCFWLWRRYRTSHDTHTS